MPIVSNRARIGRFSRSVETVSVEGFAALDRQLRVELPKATSRAVLSRAGKTAMKPMFDRAQELAPEHTGMTKASIRMVVKLLRASARFGAALRIQIGVGSREIFWPRFAERGTVHEPAKPFMRPAFDEKAREVLTLLKAALRIELGAAIARRAKKLGKG